jgi:poly(ADP-ribose) glycohydrolase ARH3
VLEAMEEGRDYRRVAADYFPGGSYGNGAAMRVAPVGLLFHDDHAKLWEQARLSALPTHVHPLGIEGAQLLALAVSLAMRFDEWGRGGFFRELCAACVSPEFRTQMEQAVSVQSVAELALLGNRIEALWSVPTAIASFGLTPQSFSDTIGNVILLGGDTDTLAAMAGAVSGAYLGVPGLAQRLVELLESSPKGRDYLIALADRMHERLT